MAISLGGFSGGGAGAVSSVNTQTGAVVLDGADINSTHTPLNYVRSDDTIDGHLTGVDLALGNISADDLPADHTASNYTAANNNIDGHLSGIDTKLGSLASGLTYKGAFNATAGTPSIANALQGDLYIIDTAGTLYGQTWAVGDHLLINEDMGGSITNSKIDKVDNTDQVTSVNGSTGAVSVDLDSVTAEGNTTTNAINVGEITTSGDILPDSDNTRTIGDESNRFISTYSDLNGAIRFKAKNNQGAQITKGQAVYISGVSGTVPEVKLAQANSSLTMPAFGLAQETANDQAAIEIVTFGNLTDYNTTTYSLSANNTVYVSAATAGALTNTAPSGESNLIQNIGRVVRADASAGIIKVGGAGRSNATPNLDQDKIFLGDASNQSVSTALSAIGLSKFNNDSAFISDITSENLGDLSDVSITSAATGEVLKYDGASWVDAQLAYSEISGTPTLATVATSGAYSDLTGTPTNVSTFTNDAGYLTDITGENLGDLSDVSITSATSGQVLSYNGASWVNAAASGGASALDDLSDVSITAAATGEVLRYNGASWVDAQLAYSDLSGTAPTPFTVTNTTATSYTASANEIINHTGSGSGAATITMPSSAVSGDVVIIRKSSGQGTMITINDPGGSKIQDVQIFPYTGNVMVTYDGTNWVVPRTNYDFQRSTQTAFTLYGYWFGRYVIYADGNDGNTFTVNIQVSATSLLEGARQLILCRGARDLVITSPSADIVDPTDGNTTDTLVNSVTVPAHGGIVEIWVNGQGQYIISAPLANLSTVATTGAYSDLTGAPTTVSTFTNDAGYLTDITGENLGDLSDVSITSATSGQVLSYNGASWVNAAAAAGGGWTYSAITADPANAQAGYHYSCTGTFTITLPTSGVSSGEEIRIKNMGTGTITIDPQTQNIDGSTTDYTLDVQYSAITLVSTGTHWEII